MIELERSKHLSVLIEEISTPQQTTRLHVDQSGGKQRRKKRKRNLDKVQFPVDDDEKTVDEEKTEGDNTITTAEHEQNPKKKLRKKRKKKTEEQSEAPNEATRQGNIEYNQQSGGVALAKELCSLEDWKDVKEGDHPLLSEQKPKEKLPKKRKQKTKEQSEAPHEAIRQEYHREDNQQSEGAIVGVCANGMEDITPSEEIRGEEIRGADVSNMVVLALTTSDVSIPKPKGQRRKALVMRMMDILDLKN